MADNAAESIRVLYVEDEKVLRDLVSDFLEALGGYEVECAINGQEGIEKAESWQPHIILMDVRMPVMDGPEAIRILRSLSETAMTPIYVLTAYADEKTRKMCKEAGADGFFAKPPSYILIDSTIKKALSQRQSHKELRREELSKSELKAAYAEKMELAYQLKIWQIDPELASTMEQLTKLTSGIIHDLRNRLGILQNYTPWANYCLRLLDGLAFLRFKPSLSRQFCKGRLEVPEILSRDLMEFSLSENFFWVQINLLKRKKRKIETMTSFGITAKGLVDSQVLSQGLWLLLQGMVGHISKLEKNQTIPQEGYIITVEDRRLLNPQFGFYITISTPSIPYVDFPETIDFNGALLGDEVALYLLILHKAVFLNGGKISINRTGIEMKAPVVLSEDDDVQLLTSHIARLAENVSALSQQYDGPQPNIYPLIKGFVAAISRELDDIAVSEAKSQKIVLRNCSYAQLLLQNLLRLGAGVELPQGSVAVGEMLESVRDIMSSEIRERTDDDDEDEDFIEVKVEIEPDLPPVFANQVSLQQVFMNLITNALEAMPESGTLILRAFQKDSEVHTEISDTGGGIPPKNLDRIFDLAFSTKQGQERGTGLYIVKSIVDELGGRIEVESELGSGTTFRVCLQGV